MTDIETNYNRNLDKPCTDNNIEEYIEDNRVMEDITNLDVANAIPDSLCNIINEQNNEQINVENDNINILQGNICKPVSVVLVRLSKKICEKHMHNRIKDRNSHKLKKRIRTKGQQIKQSNISYVINYRNTKVCLNNDITSVVNIENQVEETFLQLNDQGETKKIVLQNLEIFPSVSRYTFRSRSKTLQNMRLMYGLENFKETDNKFQQISFNEKGNDDLSLIKKEFQSKTHLDKWKYKRKSDDISCKEPDNMSNISKNPRKKRRRTESNVNKNNQKITRSELLFHSTYPNITDTSVILTKLEDIHDNKYVIDWRKKLLEQTSSVTIVDSSHKDIAKDNEHNINIKRSLIPYVCKSKYKQIGNLKVLLVKLETLGVLLKEQNKASKIEHLTARYNDMYKLNFLTHSNITTYSDESKLEPIRAEYDIINENSFDKSINTPTQQIEEKAGMQLESETVQKLVLLEDEENIKYPRVSRQRISKEEENSILSLSQVAERLQAEDTSQETLTSQTRMQKSSRKISDNSPSKEINMLLLSANKLKRKLKKIQIFPSTISSEENIYLRKPTEFNSKNVNDCEITDIGENKKKRKKHTLQKNYELNGVISSSKSITDECSSTSESEGSLIETCLSKESKTTNSDVITKGSVCKASSSNDLTKKVQEANELTFFLYSCVFCNSSFKDFQSLRLHLKDCSAKSQEKNSADENNSKLNVSLESAKIADTTTYDNFTTERNVKSPLISTGNSFTISNKSSIKSLKQKWKRNRIIKEQLQNGRDIKCSICSKIFDTMASLSNHMRSHTEAELQKEQEILKKKENCVSTSEKIHTVITNAVEKTQVDTNKPLNTFAVENTVKRSETTSENRNDESVTSKVVPTKETKSKEDVSDKSPTKSYKQPPSTYPRKSLTFCNCHKIDSNSDSIELVLLCNICNVLFRTKECFEGHFENAESSLCNTKRLTGRIPKLYCSVCRIILYSFVDMRRHAETHIKNDQRIKLLCHICKVRFIGIGPIFNLHWFNHMRNVCYTATASNFPKTALVDSKSKAWSIITSDEFKYLVVTEHVCNFCNVQFLSTNQLQSHISICPKRTKKVSEAAVANNIKNQSNESDSNLRLFCSLCNLTFLEKSLFEAHAISHKQHLQPQYICLSVTDIKRIYICNVCANVYESLKEFMTHWQDHNAIRENFMCNQCKKNFFTLETFIDHWKECNVSAIPVNVPSCEVTYRETNFSCKICNIGFESSKALYQHSGIHNVRFSGVNVICPNDAQAKSNGQEVSSLRPNNLVPTLKQSATTSNHPTVETTITGDNVTPINKNTSEMSSSNDVTCTRPRSIDSSKSLPESKSSESLESDHDSSSTSGNQSITDAETEILSLTSATSMDGLDVTQDQTISEENDNPKDSTNAIESNEVTGAASNVDDLVPVTKISNSKEKTTNGISSSTKDVNVNTTDMEDDVILIEPEVTDEKKKENTMNTTTSPTKTTKGKNDILLEALTLSGIKSNESSKTTTKPVKVTKYLRVKNIAELLDHRLKHLCPVCNINFDTQEGLKTHSGIHSPVQQSLTLPANVETLTNELLSEKNQERTDDPLDALKSPNFQQEHMVYIPVSSMPIQQQSYTSYADAGSTTRCLLTPSPPYTPSYNIPTSVANTQCQNRSNAINVNDKIKTSGTFVPPRNARSQNLNQVNESQLLLMKLLRSQNVTNSSVNNSISNKEPKKTQEHDALNRVKLKNTLSDVYTSRTHSANPPSLNSAINNAAPSVNAKQQENVCLPSSSSNQYPYYENSSTTINYLAASGSNTIQYAQPNPSTLAVNNAQVSTSQPQMSIFYQPAPVANTIFLPAQQQHTVHHRPDATPLTRALFICHYCPSIVYFPTHQELNNHLSIEHSY